LDVGSISFDGVSFRIYVHDHHPPHAHGFYGSTSVVVEFGDSENIGVRRNSVQPPNAKRNDIRKIVDTAVEHYPELMKMWEVTHG
jgi:hypothetical protein